MRDLLIGKGTIYVLIATDPKLECEFKIVLYLPAMGGTNICPLFR